MDLIQAEPPFQQPYDEFVAFAAGGACGAPGTPSLVDVRVVAHGANI